MAISKRLRSMKLDVEEYSQPCAIGAPEYPYGLEVCLDEGSLRKLEVIELPKVGSYMKIEALVEVCGVSERQLQGGEYDRRLSLQITDMALSEASAPAGDVADKLYGGE